MAINKNTILSPQNIGLVLHKILESFSVGVSIFQSSFSFSNIFSILFLYSLVTPAGAILGYFFEKKFNWLNIYFLSCSLGSLIFVVFIEVLGHSFNTQKNNFSKISILALGYFLGIMVIKMAHSK